MIRTNSRGRVADSNHVKFHNNMLESFDHWSAGGPGLLVQRDSVTLMDVEIFDNVIHNTYGAGIWLASFRAMNDSPTTSSSIRIHHNMFYTCGTNPSITQTGGILTCGFFSTIISNNVFQGNHHADLLAFMFQGKASGYTTFFHSNIVLGTLKRRNSPSSTGYTIMNYYTAKESFTMQNNDIYGSAAGHYYGTAGIKGTASDIHQDPLFASVSAHDFHLLSAFGRWTGTRWTKDAKTSPCIDAGYASSNYTCEPKGNGDRINLGVYGGTAFASLSSAAPGGTPTSPCRSPTPDSSGSKVESSVSSVVGSSSSLLSSSVVPEPSVEVVAPVDAKILEEDPTRNFFKTEDLQVGGNADGKSARSLLWWEIRTVGTPKISRATLSVWWYGTGNRPADTTIQVFRPIGWKALNVTWVRRVGSTMWSVAGGQWYDLNATLHGAEPFSVVTLKGANAPSGAYVTFDVTEVMQGYVEGTWSNSGFLLKAAEDTTGSRVSFYSAECSDPSKRPKLVVELMSQGSSVVPSEVDSTEEVPPVSSTPIRTSASSSPKVLTVLLVAAILALSLI